MVPLLTERLILRPFSLDNAKDIFELNGDSEVMKYTGETDLGYRFKKSFWGKGYGTEAATMALKDGFDRLQLKSIYAEAYSENLGSIRIMEKIGMKFLKETLLGGEPSKIFKIFNTKK